MSRSVSFPRRLSTHPQNYPTTPLSTTARPHGGQAYPPKDYGKWTNWFINGRNIAWRDTAPMKSPNGTGKRGIQPNISYWKGSRADYFKLYDYTVDGVRRALPDAKVGGPEVAGRIARRKLSRPRSWNIAPYGRRAAARERMASLIGRIGDGQAAELLGQGAIDLRMLGEDFGDRSRTASSGGVVADASSSCALLFSITDSPTGRRSAHSCPAASRREAVYSAASFQPRFIASWTPRLSPWPPWGGWMCAASPARKIRPLRYARASRRRCPPAPATWIPRT